MNKFVLLPLPVTAHLILTVHLPLALCISGFSLKVPLSTRRGQGSEPVSCIALPRAVYPQRGLQGLFSRIYGKGWDGRGETTSAHSPRVYYCPFSATAGRHVMLYLVSKVQCARESLMLSSVFQELCEPQSYCPMHHLDHKAELLRCRSQSKAQEGERQLRGQIALLVKDICP